MRGGGHDFNLWGKLQGKTSKVKETFWQAANETYLQNSSKHAFSQQILQKKAGFEGNYAVFLVSGRDLACQQEVSLALTKTPPIHYYNVVDSAFSNTRGSCAFNTREHRISRDTSERKRNLHMWRTPRDEFGFLDWNIYFHKGSNYSNETNEYE